MGEWAKGANRREKVGREIKMKAGENYCLGVWQSRWWRRRRSKAREGQQDVEKRFSKRKFVLVEEMDSWKRVCIGEREVCVRVCERASSVTRGEVILSEGEGRKRCNSRRSNNKKKTRRHKPAWRRHFREVLLFLAIPFTRLSTQICDDPRSIPSRFSSYLCLPRQSKCLPRLTNSACLCNSKWGKIRSMCMSVAGEDMSLLFLKI